jgi:hypothetical protein
MDITTINLHNIASRASPLANSATKVFKNNNLLQRIYEFDITYHLIYQDVLDECFSAYKEHWNKKLYKLIAEYKESVKYNEIMNTFKYNYRISSKYM